MESIYLKRIVAKYVIESEVTSQDVMADPEIVAKSFNYLRTSDREEFVVLHLDMGNRPVCWDRVAVGTVNEVMVYPRDVFKTALLSNAKSIVLIHNHPSGRIEPSNEDRLITHKLKSAADLLGIRILDHLILGAHSEDFYSFRSHGLM